MSPYVSVNAVLSEDGVYRYRLSRVWDPTRPACGFIMLNPSTADASVDDATIRKCVKYARAWGCGSLEVVNLFAFRSTDPKALLTSADPVGPECDEYIGLALVACRTVVVGWGRGVPPGWGWRVDRVRQLAAGLGHRLTCLALNGNGSPKHPLYCRDDLTLIAYPDAAKAEG